MQQPGRYRYLEAGDFVIPSNRITYMRYFPNEKDLLIHVDNGKYVSLKKEKVIRKFLRQLKQHMQQTKTRGYRVIEKIEKQL